ncbi:LEAF RUST 10 DISEASE-RESISTANCE LOCUS RECEPTOR-LIKE PROTEIN KINASE-like 2.1 [Sesamum alatum]|uniref:LEAF RUST 10 DISEASE-RESISTANCE LOCUS RECEPTOR-LIKE PROTEIN KINASE-like 2.1 n=1 Tax=Sesamum alatum TaxID=300844 RepID=A0AAE2CLT3_9LAMI|nr:LEAF RUST 10 DISEASE-RESISTANCE LOCUS RECEPTOR-LIKE PROTEIN KINASE-like 2.1 [Sesamum alatum]
MQPKPKQELFLFLMTTLLPLHYCQYDEPIQNCSLSFQCGGSIGNFSYPFSGGDQPEACGYSGFQLFNCEDKFPVLYIPPLNYRILERNFSTRTLKVARQDFLNNKCLPDLYNTTLNSLYKFAPNSNDENVTLFFGCVDVPKKGLLAINHHNRFGCIDLFRTGNTSSGPGPNITCNHTIYVPVNRAAARALKIRTSSSKVDILQQAFAGGFLIQWSTPPPPVRTCTDNTCKRYKESQWSTQVAAAPLPVYQEEPREGGKYRQSQRIYIVVAISGGGVIIVSIIVCCCYLKRRRYQQSGPNKKNIEKFLVQHGSLAPKRYKYSEIKKITKSFKDKLGRGGYGSVYHGVLPDGCPIAVKVLIDSDSNGEEFINEKKQSMLSVFGARGTIGYIAPEVFSRNFGGVSHKSDVYSYGMMVLEMAGAKKFVEPDAAQSSENYFPDRIYEQTNPSDRPPMSKVVEMLEGSLESIPVPPKPFLFTPSFPTSGPETPLTFSTHVELESSVEA